MEQIECSETSAYINQTPGNHPKENKQHSEHGESLKPRIYFHILTTMHGQNHIKFNLFWCRFMNTVLLGSVFLVWHRLCTQPPRQISCSQINLQVLLESHVHWILPKSCCFEKYMTSLPSRGFVPQLQHNMLADSTNTKVFLLSFEAFYSILIFYSPMYVKWQRKEMM